MNFSDSLLLELQRLAFMRNMRFAHFFENIDYEEEIERVGQRGRDREGGAERER